MAVLGRNAAQQEWREMRAIALLQFGHNYNAVSRMQLYTFLNKQFKLGLQLILLTMVRKSERSGSC